MTMFTKMLVLATAVCLGVLIYILNATTPANVSPVIILVLFGSMYVTTVGVLSFLMYGSQLLLRKLLYENHRSHLLGVKFLEFYYYASVIALAPVILLAMQSVGKLGVYEVALVLVFEVVTLFYVYRRRLAAV